MSFSFVATVTIDSDFGAQENKVYVYALYLINVLDSVSIGVLFRPQCNSTSKTIRDRHPQKGSLHALWVNCRWKLAFAGSADPRVSISVPKCFMAPGLLGLLHLDGDF